LVQQSAFDYLDAPVERLCTPHVPIPYSPPLENSIRPDAEKIMRRAKEMIS
jgi:pyruvate dehydrogenase E1 component beta subunit